MDQSTSGLEWLVGHRKNSHGCQTSRGTEQGGLENCCGTVLSGLQELLGMDFGG